VSTLHLVVPAGFDEPARPSGGNHYDLRLREGLTVAGWDVHTHPVPGSWPQPDTAATAALTGVICGLPDGALLLIDGLIASAAASELVPHAIRLRLAVLVHLPLGDESPGGRPVRKAEGETLGAASLVVTTSDWTRRRLLRLYRLAPERIVVAAPGVDPAEPASGTRDGGELLCVAAVAPHKGHDLLIGALAGLDDRPWRCTCVGPLDRDPVFVTTVRRAAAAAGIADRIRFTGARAGASVAPEYDRADVLVLPSRVEAYGMVITEALARGLPVIATEVGGIPEALGHASEGHRPGLLVAPGDAAALGSALRRWLDEPQLRASLRATARARRETLTGWDVTVATIARALAGGNEPTVASLRTH
jgi:glycosyltransferase involved in cell wall biosynthesis